MAANKSKNKLRPPKVADKELSRIVDNIYDELNKVSSGASQGPTSQSIRFTSINQSQLPQNPNFNNVSLDTLQFDTSYVSTELESQGTLYWNQDEETLSLVTNGQTIELGQKTEIHVRNNTGSQINKGEVVYASGTVGNSGRILITKMIADGTVTAKRIMGVAAENIANSTDGKIITFGKLKNINTSSFSDGDILYASATTAGAFQNTEPSQANGHVSLPIAYVIHAHSNGQIFIRVTPIDENEYQDYDAGLADIAGLTPTDSTIIVGDGTNWVAESGDTARTSLGLGTGDSPTFSRVVLSNQADDGTKAVRADRSLAINPDANNVITFDLTGLQDLTSNRTWTPTIADHANGQRGVLSVNAQTIYGAKTFNDASTFNTSILLDDTAKFESEAGFIAGFDAGEGFRLKRESGLWELELDDMYIRGALFASEFIVNQISAVNGSDILSPGRGKVEEISSTFYTVSDPQGGNFASFAVNDIVIVQQVQPNDNQIVKRIVKQVIDVTDNVIELATLSGAPADLGSIEIGDIIVAIGSTSDTDRQANIFRTVTDSDSPYVRVNDGISSWAEWTGVNKLKVQYGKLDGLSSLSSNIEGYGLYAENTFLTGALLVGDLDKAGNYLEYNGTDLNIVTDTFNLEASNLYINSGTVSQTPYTPSSQNSVLENYNFSVTPLYAGGGGNDWTGASSSFSTLSYDATNDRTLFDIDKSASSTRVYIEQEIDDLSSLVDKEVTFTVSVTNGDSGTSSRNWAVGELYFEINAEINGSYQVLKRTVIDYTDVSGGGGTSTFNVTGKIRSDFTNVKVVVDFPEQDTTTGAPITSHRIYINSVETVFYNQTQVTLNTNGLTIYNSPDSQINLNNTGFSLEGIALKTDDISIPNLVEQDAISTSTMRVADDGYVSIAYTEISGTGRLYVRLSDGTLKYVNLT
jgi:hypothetical protein